MLLKGLLNQRRSRFEPQSILANLVGISQGIFHSFQETIRKVDKSNPLKLSGSKRITCFNI
jgi:hypothetical protein